MTDSYIHVQTILQPFFKTIGSSLCKLNNGASTTGFSKSGTLDYFIQFSLEPTIYYYCITIKLMFLKTKWASK